MMISRKFVSVFIVGALLTLGGEALAQTDPPHIMVLFDTSGSMLFDLDGDLTGGDGSYSLTPHGNYCCPGWDRDGQPGPDGETSRIYIAKEVINEAVWGVGEGEIVFGLARYWQGEHPGWTQCNNNTAASYYGNGDGGCSVTYDGYHEDHISYSGANCDYSSQDSGNILVPYDASDANRDEFLSWIDHHEESTSGGGFTNPELRGINATPLSGSIDTLRDYFRDDIVGNPCQQFAVVLTDGDQSWNCDGDPVDAVESLRDPDGDGTPDVTVYVIAFTIDDATSLTRMDNMAAAGGTDYARRASSREELRAAFAEIIEAAIQVEVCDAIDNDCDGTIDEDLYRPCSTVCGEGQEECTMGVWGECSAVEPALEECNDLDDDCDGEIDEELTRSCDNDCGAGTETCSHGDWVGCTAPQGSLEVCDGDDNDCDGEVDEDDPLVGTACGTETGECTTGTWSCSGGELVCSGTTPADEICDNLDNDCDGFTDEGLTRECTNGPCTGVETCDAGGWVGCDAPAPTSEVCNDVDDDCDGSVDEGLTQACSTACGDGTRTCTEGSWGACSAEAPEAETCDGEDNDCDGETDEGLWRECSVGSCTGWERCTGPDTWGDCSAVVELEVCDNEDNDCDGETDEDLSRVCTTICGDGEQICSAGTWGACSAPSPEPEVCDGEDNDCDGVADDGLTRACSVGSCTGEETCVDGAWVGCTASASSEVCDNVDNDCDGSVDEGLSRACSTICGEGTETCSEGAWVGCTADSPEVEICDGEDNDCDGATDEGVTRACTVGTCSGIQHCIGADTWDDCEVATRPEVCDGEDNDCDGDIDEDDSGDALVRACSTVCGVGTQVCAGGAWGDCSAPTPSLEVCDGVDNDCNGLIDDGVTRACSTICGDGVESCVDGFWGPCSAPEPTDEVCDGFDNDCDGDTDEDDPDLSEDCGTDEGVCELGYYACLGGVLECLDDIEPTDELCDALDNDCDGEVDEGLPLGEECDDDTGLGDEGQCEWGHYICADGGLVCEGYVGPSDEICDCIDNDCNGETDEGLPNTDPCGVDEGECMRGTIQCVDCELTCVGAVGPEPEQCDCLDNDCDGETDENPDELCPGDSVCIDCECLAPCGEGEFPCPPDKYCADDGFCHPSLCYDVSCDTCERCDSETGECEPRCDAVECTEGEACLCDEDTGATGCYPDNCYYFGCEDGQICQDGECVEDACASVECGENEFCRDGECVDMCVDGCPNGQICVDGACQDDPCADVVCETGTCDPATGECSDACEDVNCPEGRVCDVATGECVDDPCLSIDCPEGSHCEDATCVPDEVDTDGGPSDAGPEDAGQYLSILATGGGGCMCAAATTTPAQAKGGLLIAALALLGLAWIRRRP